MTVDESVIDVRSLNSKGPLEIFVSEVSCPSTPDEPSTTVDTENIPGWEPQPSLWKPLCYPRVDEVSCPSTPDEPSTAVDTQNIPSWEPQPSLWKPLCHPRVDEVSLEVDRYFLHHWKFPSEKAAKAFIDAAFSRVTCLYFPLAQDDRIHFACRLLTVLFLIDDKLEDMSFKDGEEYNEKLIPISRGEVLPDRSVPVEYILYDLWESMRAHDKYLADEVLEPVFTFMRAQTDKARLEINELGQYLEYREKDVGKALLSALMRFSMALSISHEELATLTPLEQNCSKQISVVNDVYSWEKELYASQTGHREGSALCSAVKVLVDETKLNTHAAKRVLWSLIREWELSHDELAAQRLANPGGCSQAVKDYIKGLEYQMSGNELWSKTTLRYNKVG